MFSVQVDLLLESYRYWRFNLLLSEFRKPPTRVKTTVQDRDEYIRFKYTDTVQQKSDGLDNSHIRKNYIVQIDIFATNSLRSALYKEQVENILFEFQPNSSASSRIPKTNGETSGIVTFDRQALEWLEIGTFEDLGLVREWQAEIGCLFQKNKT